jgi:hypothetical protein
VIRSEIRNQEAREKKLRNRLDSFGGSIVQDEESTVEFRRVPLDEKVFVFCNFVSRGDLSFDSMFGPP